MQGFRIVCFVVAGFSILFIAGCNSSSNPTNHNGQGNPGTQTNIVNFQAPQLTRATLISHEWSIRSAYIDKDEFPDIVGLELDHAQFYLSDGKGFSKRTFSKDGYEFGSDGDFNQFFDRDHDGDDDWMLRKSGSFALTFYRNNGNGDFTAWGSLSLPNAQSTILIADVNDDGDSDFVYTQGADSIAVILNNAHGGYMQPFTFWSGSSVASIICADFTGDHKRDIAASDYDGHKVLLFGNTGGTTFSRIDSVSFLVERPLYLAAADMDGDGSTDLTVTAEGNDNLLFLRNNGIGHFTKEPVYSTYYHIVKLILSDVDIDNDTDIIFCTRVTTRNNLIVLKNNGSGQFTDTLSFGYKSYLQDMTLADYNTDGRPDIGVALELLTVGVYLGNDSGTFMYPQSVPLGKDQRQIVVSDIDRNGSADIISVDNDFSFTIAAGNGSGFAPSVTHALPFRPMAVAIDDFDGNHSPDMAIAGGGNLRIQYINSSGSFDSLHDFSGIGGIAIASGDFDGNGHVDLFVTEPNQSNVLFNDGSGQFDSVVAYPIGVYSQYHFIGDFDGDLDLDIALCERADNTENTSRLFILKNNGAGVFTEIDTLSTGEYVTGISGGDFDTDNDLDLVVSFSSSQARIYRNDAGVFVPADIYSTDFVTRDPVVADFDNDQDEDIAFADYWASGIAVILNDGTGAFLPAQVFGFAQTPMSLSKGDMDNDGDIDLVAGNIDSRTATVFYNLLK